VARGDGGLQDAVGAGQDDVLARGDRLTVRGDLDVVAVGARGVDPAVAAGPGLVDRVPLCGPVIEVPGHPGRLPDLDEAGLDRVRPVLLRAADPEGVPAVGILPDLVAVAAGAAVGA